VGTDAYNDKLSVRRAQAVRDYLVGKGVDPNLIDVQGRGKREPVASNKTEEGRAQNRRVEVEVDGSRTVVH
jgi:OOP family OmpA-OmpF porin